VAGRITRHRLRVAAEPATWTTLAGAARWARAAPCSTPDPCPAPGTGIAVRWPTRYESPFAHCFTDPIREGLAALATVEPADIAQHHHGVVVTEMSDGGPAVRVAYDWEDLPAVKAACADEVDVYFKLQYQRGGYPGHANIVPGGYVTDALFLYRNWCRLRRLRSTREPNCDVFARFGMRAGAPLRRAALELLAADGRIAFRGGTRTTLHKRYLAEMARARVCVDLPGRGPFCCRLVEGLAMGCCFVAVRHGAELPRQLRDGVEIVYCADDLSDLADLCHGLARDPERRRAIGCAAARFFDENLHPVSLAAYHLRVAFPRAIA
jgi:hypothetical protein